MTSKEYLKQIRELDMKIEHLNSMKQELLANMAMPKAVSYDKERVDVSPNSDGMINMIIRLEELSKKINNQLMEFFELKSKIVNQIHEIHDYRYIDVLYKRYVEYKSFELIAVEMGYEYQTILNYHGEALLKFAEKYKMSR